jgi:WD40 repeat protein
MNLKSHVIGNWVKPFCFAVFLLGSVGGLSKVTTGQTGEPSREPIIRIETGRHIAYIHQVSLDAVNRYLVTASDDKTARLWELRTGRLVRVLRPPIDTSNEGQLYATAISPDGNTIAVGTATAGSANKTESIYIFDRLSGKLLNRLADATANVNYLVYSPDSHYLAATLESGTLFVYDARSNYRLSSRNSECGKNSFSADADHRQAKHDSGFSDCGEAVERIRTRTAQSGLIYQTSCCSRARDDKNSQTLFERDCFDSPCHGQRSGPEARTRRADRPLR